MPQLHILQSIWGMDRRQSDGREWSLAERFAMIREAGFDGISHHFHTAAEVEAWIDEALDHGFVIEGQCFPRTVDELRPVLELASRYGIHHLTIQADVRPYGVEGCIPILDGWRRMARAAGVPVYVETHRGRMTTDLLLTHHILDRIPDLELVADLSHYVVGQEIELPVSPRHAVLLERILDSACGFHGRVASSEQVQLELSFPCHAPWVEQFMAWWAYGLRSWRQRAAPDDSLTFTCELGPKPYAISGPDGNDLSDRWEEAKLLKARIEALWSGLNRETAAA
jgi:hypothetical protein